jgi:hypothetical protein
MLNVHTCFYSIEIWEYGEPVEAIYWQLFRVRGRRAGMGSSSALAGQKIDECGRDRIKSGIAATARSYSNQASQEGAGMLL